MYHDPNHAGHNELIASMKTGRQNGPAEHFMDRWLATVIPSSAVEDQLCKRATAAKAISGPSPRMVTFIIDTKTRLFMAKIAWERCHVMFLLKIPGSGVALNGEAI